VPYALLNGDPHD
jgi:5'-AMP-activated protein kinase, catalytic alpha subunit